MRSKFEMRLTCSSAVRQFCSLNRKSFLFKYIILLLLFHWIIFQRTNDRDGRQYRKRGALPFCERGRSGIERFGLGFIYQTIFRCQAPRGYDGRADNNNTIHTTRKVHHLSVVRRCRWVLQRCSCRADETEMPLRKLVGARDIPSPPGFGTR